MTVDETASSATIRVVTRWVQMALVCLATVGSATACGSDGGSAGGDTSEQATVGISVPDSTLPWFTTFNKVIEAEAEQQGWDPVLLSGEGDPSTQADTIADLVSRDVDLLMVAPGDGQAVVPSVRAAQGADIPVLMVADPIADEGLEYVTAQSVADNCKQAKKAARTMAEETGGSGEVITLEGLPGQPAAVARTNCFREELSAVAPDLRIVASQPYDWDPVKAQSVAEDLLTRFPEASGLWIHDDNAAAAVCQVLEKKNLTDVVVVSTGGSKNGVQAVESGCITATVRQSPTAQAEEAVALAAKILDGEQVSKTNYSPMPVVTADNADQYPGDW